MVFSNFWWHTWGKMESFNHWISFKPVVSADHIVFLEDALLSRPITAASGSSCLLTCRAAVDTAYTHEIY